MEIGEKLFSIPGYDVGTAIPNEDRDGIVGYTYATDRVRRKFTDERLATVQKFLAEDFGEGNAVIVSSDDGDKRLIVSMASPEQNGSYSLSHVESGKFALLGQVRKSRGSGERVAVGVVLGGCAEIKKHTQ